MKKKMILGISLALLLSACSTNNNKVENKEEIKQDNTSEVETKELTVEDILSNPSQYEGKEVKIHGSLPQALLMNDEGKEITAIQNLSKDQYIETTGVTPEFGGCDAYVTGIVNIVEGNVVSDVSNYEQIK